MELKTNLSTTDSARMRIKNHRRRRFRGVAFHTSVGLTLLVAAAVGASLWLSAKASSISSEMQSAADILPGLKESILRSDAEAAEAAVAKLTSHTSAAREAGADPIWTAAGTIPWIGANFRAASEVTTSIDDVAQLGAVPLVGVFQSLDWKTLTPHEDGIDLTPIAQARPKLQAAAHAVSQSTDRLFGIETSGLLPEVANQLTAARNQLSPLRDGLAAAADVAAIAPTMMGYDQPKQILVLVQNNAEARATGGIPGALAVLKLSQGKVTLGAQSSAVAMGRFTPPIPLDSYQEAVYSKRLGTYMQDINLSPDFPTTARIAHSMWEEKFDEKVDGVISIDPVALSFLLEATGPVMLSDDAAVEASRVGLATELSAQNVVSTLLSDVYSRMDEPLLQDAYFAASAKEIFDVVARGTGNPQHLLAAVERGVHESRIHLWSTDSQYQSIISRYPISGSITGRSVSPAQFGVYFNDGTGAKMDYYVRRSVQLIKECSQNGYQQTTVRITSTNAAPLDASTALPAYVTGDGNFGIPPGSVQTNIVTYGPAQANVETVKQDGQRADFAPYSHGNRPVGVVAVRLAPGESKTIDFTFGKIVQHTEPNVVVTPTVQDVKDVILPTVNASCD